MEINHYFGQAFKNGNRDWIQTLAIQEFKTDFYLFLKELEFQI